MRNVLLLSVLAALVAGCGDMSAWQFGKKPAAKAPSEPAKSAPSAAPAKTSPGADKPTAEPQTAVMAFVNGRAIPMSDLYDLLVRTHGLQTAYQLVADELVRQAAADKDLTVNDEEVKAEGDRTLRELFGQVEQADQRERLLQQLLDQRGISHKQWQLIMRRNALLRKLAEPLVTVSDEELAEEFGREYGRKVIVRHIQTESLASVQEALDRIKAGEDFAELAAKMSVNPSAAEGGLLPPIGADSTMIPPAVREAALAMRRVGEVSAPIQVETAFHILRLERIIEPQTVDFSQVRDKLAEEVRNRRLRAEQQKLLQELIQAAQDKGTILYTDPVVRAQVQAAEDRAER